MNGDLKSHLTSNPKVPPLEVLRAWAADPENDQCWGLDAVADQIERLTRERDQTRAELNSTNGHWPEIRRLRAALGCLQAMRELPSAAYAIVRDALEGLSDETSGWQPIETADTSRLFATSTWVLVATDEPRVTEAWPLYVGDNEYIWVAARGDNLKGSRGEYLRYRPTHWMPLPAPPGAAEETSDG